MFETFGEYMYELLFGPLKKAKRAINQFSIFFTVIGKLFDENKQDLFKVREQRYIISCAEAILSEVGKERDMPKLDGENIENYRARLMMKNEVAEQAGTNLGIVKALIAAGYKDVYIEPFYLQDAERWAEFIVYLGENTAGVKTDVTKIDKEVSKIKPASSKANYITEKTRKIIIESDYSRVGIIYPMCGLQRCGESIKPY